jgi:hypothetical protein
LILIFSCGAIKQWEDEILCLRELLGALQTLSWDRQCVKGVLQADIVSHLVDFADSSDQEVSVLALATLANILYFSDTLLLSDNLMIEALGTALPTLVKTLRNSGPSAHKPQRLYAAAAIANASYHPRLVALLNQSGALVLCREIERQSLMNLLNVLGSKLGECAQTAVYRLSDKKEGSAKLGAAKYSFKWGTRPVMELSLANYSQHTCFLSLCFFLWVFILVFTFMPLLFT